VKSIEHGNKIYELHSQILALLSFKQ